MRTLLFVRRRIDTALEQIGRTLVGDDDLITVSDERFIRGALWWGHYGRESSTSTVDLSAGEVEDVIRRCRMLRQLPLAKSKELIAQASSRWLDFLQSHRVERALLLPVDSYILHVLVLVCGRLGIPAFSIAQTSITNRLRFTLFGEVVGENDESVDELVEELLHRVRRETVRPGWLIGLDAPPWRVALRRLVFNAIKGPAFFTYRIVSGDRDSFLYAPTRLRKRYMTPTLRRFLTAVRIEREGAEAIPDDFALIPLQFYPEVTSDYWIRESEMHDHHNAVLAVARAVSAHIPVVMKEHPASFGRRSASFMRELSSIPNLLFAPLKADMNELLRRARFVAGQCSTTTLHAQMLGKQVLFLGTPYMGTCSGSVVLRDLSRVSIEEAISEIFRADHQPQLDEIRQMVARFARCTGAGDLGFTPLFERTQRVRPQAFAGDDLRRIFNRLTSAALGRSGAGACLKNG